MGYCSIVKRNGRWGVYTFSEGEKFSPKAFSEKKFSPEEEDEAESANILPDEEDQSVKPPSA